MRVMDLMTSYLVALKCADSAFESDQRANRREPSRRYLKAQERLDRVKADLEKCQIRPFTGWGIN